MKRLLAWLLSLLLLLSMLTGCGDMNLQDLEDFGEAIGSAVSSALEDADEWLDEASESMNAGRAPPAEESADLPEDGSYTTKEDVALYLHLYGHLPENFLTKDEAKALGWEGGGLEDYAPGMCIGGDRFGNYEGLLPKADGRSYTECDIDTLGADSRGAKRIVFSNDGLIFYTDDHYESFTQLYDEEGAV